MSWNPVVDMTREPFIFACGEFKGSHLNCDVMHNKARAILRVYWRLLYLLWGGFDFSRGNRTLGYIFSPVAYALTLSESTTCAKLECVYE